LYALYHFQNSAVKKGAVFCWNTVPDKETFLNPKKGEQFFQTIGEVGKADLAGQLSGFSMPEAVHEDELRFFCKGALLLKVTAIQVVAVKEDDREPPSQNLIIDILAIGSIEIHFLPFASVRLECMLRVL